MKRVEALRILGLSRDFDTKDLKKVYRDKIKSVHPDNSDNCNEAVLINEAYNLLKSGLREKQRERFESDALILYFRELVSIYNGSKVIKDNITLDKNSIAKRNILFELNVGYITKDEDSNERFILANNYKNEYDIKLKVNCDKEIGDITIKIYGEEKKIKGVKKRCTLNMRVLNRFVFNIYLEGVERDDTGWDKEVYHWEKKW